MASPLISQLLTFLSLFLLHRSLSFNFLADGLPTDIASIAKAFLVGGCSDLWVSTLLTFSLFLTHSTSKIVTRRDCRIINRPLLSVLLLLFLCFHQSYTSFFRVPLVYEHLEYAFDRVFVSSNISSALDPASLPLLLIGIIIIFVGRSIRFNVHSRKALPVGVVLALSAHAFNIKYRVQWFVPPSLQTNVLENLYLQASKNLKVRSLSSYELRLLSNHLTLDKSYQNSVDAMIIKSSSRPQDSSNDLASLIRADLSNLRASKQKPLILTVMLESFRAVDSCSYYPQSVCLTPEFDSLAANGILFTNAWSTGTVTRSGQEAAWCGYPSAMSHSLMREKTELKFPCLTNFIDPLSGFWFHGGEGKFDNQQYFWRAQKVALTKSISDYPNGLPATTWGIGDKALFQLAGDDILGLHKNNNSSYLFGMILSMSHHIPWHLPSDYHSSPNSEISFPQNHPSEKTLWYSDHALGELRRKLVKHGLWEKTLLVVLGDHGTKLPPLNQLSPTPNLAVSASKLGFLLSGGIATRALEKKKRTQHRVEEHVSQLDIAPFLAYVLKIDSFQSMGETLLRGPRTTPVFSDLGGSVYFPELPAEIQKEEALSRKLDTLESYKLKISLLYFRAIQESIKRWSVKRTAPF